MMQDKVNYCPLRSTMRFELVFYCVHGARVDLLSTFELHLEMEMTTNVYNQTKSHINDIYLLLILYNIVHSNVELQNIRNHIYNRRKLKNDISDTAALGPLSLLQSARCDSTLGRRASGPDQTLAILTLCYKRYCLLFVLKVPSVRILYSGLFSYPLPHPSYSLRRRIENLCPIEKVEEPF